MASPGAPLIDQRGAAHWWWPLVSGDAARRVLSSTPLCNIHSYLPDTAAHALTTEERCNLRAARVAVLPAESDRATAAGDRLHAPEGPN
ncbi:hypothetical protein M3J09_005531 [Ascochyta lentis]